MTEELYFRSELPDNFLKCFERNSLIQHSWNSIKQYFYCICREVQPDLDIIEKEWNAIEMAYNEYQRSHHDRGHLVSMFTALGRIADRFGYADAFLNMFSLEEQIEIVLAIIYHDFVYIPGGTHNELCSMERAEYGMNIMGFSRYSIDSVKSIIFCTDPTKYQTHRNVLEDFVVALDLDGLAEPNYKDFLIRQLRVFEEYPFFNRDACTEGSKIFFRQMLEMDPIIPCFSDAPSREKNIIARSNMEIFVNEQSPFDTLKSQ